MMKHRRIHAALALLLCAAALLSCTLLVFHAEQHCCRFAVCPACIALECNIMAFICVLALLACCTLIGRTGAHPAWIASENRFVPDWTLVQRKVKLLN